MNLKRVAILLLIAFVILDCITDVDGKKRRKKKKKKKGGKKSGRKGKVGPPKNSKVAQLDAYNDLGLDIQIPNGVVKKPGDQGDQPSNKFGSLDTEGNEGDNGQVFGSKDDELFGPPVYEDDGARGEDIHTSDELMGIEKALHGEAGQPHVSNDDLDLEYKHILANEKRLLDKIKHIEKENKQIYRQDAKLTEIIKIENKEPLIDRLKIQFDNDDSVVTQIESKYKDFFTGYPPDFDLDNYLPPGLLDDIKETENNGRVPAGIKNEDWEGWLSFKWDDCISEKSEPEGCVWKKLDQLYSETESEEKQEVGIAEIFIAYVFYACSRKRFDLCPDPCFKVGKEAACPKKDKVLGNCAVASPGLYTDDKICHCLAGFEWSRARQSCIKGDEAISCPENSPCDAKGTEFCTQPNEYQTYRCRCKASHSGPMCNEIRNPCVKGYKHPPGYDQCADGICLPQMASDLYACNCTGKIKNVTLSDDDTMQWPTCPGDTSLINKLQEENRTTLMTVLWICSGIALLLIITIVVIIAYRKRKRAEEEGEPEEEVQPLLGDKYRGSLPEPPEDDTYLIPDGGIQRGATTENVNVDEATAEYIDMGGANGVSEYEGSRRASGMSNKYQNLDDVTGSRRSFATNHEYANMGDEDRGEIDDTGALLEDTYNTYERRGSSAFPNSPRSLGSGQAMDDLVDFRRSVSERRRSSRMSGPRDSIGGMSMSGRRRSSAGPRASIPSRRQLLPDDYAGEEMNVITYADYPQEEIVDDAEAHSVGSTGSLQYGDIDNMGNLQYGDVDNNENPVTRNSSKKSQAKTYSRHLVDEGTSAFNFDSSTPKAKSSNLKNPSKMSAGGKFGEGYNLTSKQHIGGCFQGAKVTGYAIIVGADSKESLYVDVNQGKQFSKAQLHRDNSNRLYPLQLRYKEPIVEEGNHYENYAPSGKSIGMNGGEISQSVAGLRNYQSQKSYVSHASNAQSLQSSHMANPRNIESKYSQGPDRAASAMSYGGPNWQRSDQSGFAAPDRNESVYSRNINGNGTNSFQLIEVDKEPSPHYSVDKSQHSQNGYHTTGGTQGEAVYVPRNEKRERIHSIRSFNPSQSSRMKKHEQAPVYASQVATEVPLPHMPNSPEVIASEIPFPDNTSSFPKSRNKLQFFTGPAQVNRDGLYQRVTNNKVIGTASAIRDNMPPGYEPSQHNTDSLENTFSQGQFHEEWGMNQHPTAESYQSVDRMNQAVSNSYQPMPQVTYADGQPRGLETRLASENAKQDSPARNVNNYSSASSQFGPYGQPRNLNSYATDTVAQPCQPITNPCQSIANPCQDICNPCQPRANPHQCMTNPCHCVAKSQQSVAMSPVSCNCGQLDRRITTENVRQPTSASGVNSYAHAIREFDPYSSTMQMSNFASERNVKNCSNSCAPSGTENIYTPSRYLNSHDQGKHLSNCIQENKYVTQRDVDMVPERDFNCAPQHGNSYLSESDINDFAPSNGIRPNNYSSGKGTNNITSRRDVSKHVSSRDINRHSSSRYVNNHSHQNMRASSRHGGGSIDARVHAGKRPRVFITEKLSSKHTFSTSEGSN